jgi:hypothetical protein
MASPKYSFIFVTPEEFENCRTASDGAATTASWPVTGAACQPPRTFSAPVGVMSKLKKKNESLAISSHDSTLHNAPVTTPVFPYWMSANNSYLFMRIHFLLRYYFCSHPAFRPRLGVQPLRNILKLLRNIPNFQPPAQPTLILTG